MMEYVFGVVGLIAFLYVVISTLRNKKIKGLNTALWIVAAILFSILTAIVYYFKYDSK